jgi:UDP-4-amino-4,6-dideoxy-L-N-acetyl-beta-L-altrosamine transaminase
MNQGQPMLEPEKFLPYAKQTIDASDIEEVIAALSADIITRGEYVDVFERAVAEYCGAQYAVAFNSGTSALQASCHVIDLGPQDKIITTPNTFVATVGAAMQRGAQPIFVDIDRESGNLNLDQLGDTLKEIRSTRGRVVILPVHFAGVPVDMKKLESLIRDPNTLVIEDAAHALGSTYRDGQRVGSCAWSQMTMLSFHPAKTITTGEGGMVLTNDSSLYHRLRRFRNNGIERDPAYLKADLESVHEGYYEVVELSGNYNFTDFQAALGKSQLEKIDNFVAKRQELITLYRRLLRDLPDTKMLSESLDKHTAYHLCVLQIDFPAYNTSRKYVMQQLRENGIGTQVHYIPLYRHPFFTKNNPEIELSPYFPEMEAYYSQALSLPLYTSMTHDDVYRVVNTLKDILVAERQKRHKRLRR